jgi:hypothetical protein
MIGPRLGEFCYASDVLTASVRIGRFGRYTVTSRGWDKARKNKIGTALISGIPTSPRKGETYINV